MLFFLFISWLLAGTPPGVMNAQPGSNAPSINEPTNKPKPKVLPPTAADSAFDSTDADCCGPDPPPTPRRPGDE